MKTIAIILAIAAMLVPGVTVAAEIEHHSVNDQGYVTLIGDIEQGDADKLRRIAASTAFDTLFLESDGGNLAEALEIGRIVSVSNARTVVINGSTCASSCALIWLAGSPRIAQAEARIGFHAGYVLEDDKPVPSGMGNAVVGRYLTQLGLSERAVMYATAASPDEMLWIDTSSPGSEGFSYEILGHEEADEPARPATNVTRASSRTRTTSLDGKTYGAWTVHIAEDVFAATADATNGNGRLGYLCGAGRNCRYALKFDMSCDAGRTYSINYQVDGYGTKPAQITCDMDGDLLYLTDFNGFSDDIAGEIGVTIIATDTEKEESRYRFSLVGLIEAVAAMTDAGYLHSSNR